jgi:hypothetical protein
MKNVVLVALALVTLLIPTEALAVKMAVNVDASNMELNGFSVAMSKEGVLEVTVTRDLSKARTVDAASDLRLVRIATLEVGTSSGPALRCNLEPEVKAGTVVYRFTIAPEHLERCRLTVSEIDDYKAELQREHLLGGGTFYNLKIAELVKG